MSSVPIDGSLPLALPDDPADRLAALFDTHYDRLYRLARRLTDSADDALDLLQDTFLKAARAPATIPQGVSHEEAWLVRILVNTRRDQWRRALVRRRHGPERAEPAPVDNGQESALVARAAVRSALATLPPRRRAVVLMHELEGLTTSEIGSLLGISAITVRWHLAVARRALIRLLNPSDRSHP